MVQRSDSVAVRRPALAGRALHTLRRLAIRRRWRLARVPALVATSLVACVSSSGATARPSTALVEARLGAPAWPPRLSAHRDSPDMHAGPLDLASAALGQQETQFELRVGARRAWPVASLAVDGPRALCVVFSYRPVGRSRFRVCVAASGGAPMLRREAVDARGSPAGPPTDVDASVSLDRDRRLLASFSPLDVGLPLGDFGWHVESRWVQDPDCAAAVSCADRLPDAGEIRGRAALLAVPACFGAAARDPWRPCANPRLRRTVTPAPSDALITPNSPCIPVSRSGLVHPCTFGASAAQARATVALVGDSHAEHWRAAIEVVAQAQRWRGISITRSSCPFNRSQAALATPTMTATCARWNAETRRWLSKHREVRTVLTSNHSGARFAQGAMVGYRATWRQLPSTIRHVYVLRDTPRIVRPQAGCVSRLIRAHAAVGIRCAQPRALDVLPDPAAAAAIGSGDARVRLLDLTPLMCTPRVCPAVIGGVLVRKDGAHLTRLFATTLGPFVLRAIRRAG